MSLARRDSAIKLISWNVNSVRMRMPILKRIIEQEKPELLLLQELKCTDSKFPPIDGYHSYVFGQKSYNGVAILSKYPLKEVERFGEEARGIKGVLDDICIMCVYVPCGGGGADKYDYKRRFLMETIEWIGKMRGKYDKVVIGGDFNVALTDADVEYPEEYTGSVLCRPDVRSLMEKVMELVTDVIHVQNESHEIDPTVRARVIDPGAEWREYQTIPKWAVEKAMRSSDAQQKNPFTWWDYRSPNKGLRIDYVLSSGIRAEQKILGDYRRMGFMHCNEGKEELTKPSDHVPIVAIVG